MPALTLLNDNRRATGLRPDGPFWAVGDVHGRYDLLAPLLDKLLSGNEKIVLLGDYINRGPDSAKVLQLIHQAIGTGQVIALRGNHEELLLAYLTRPRKLTPQFLRYGGTATLASFGIQQQTPNLGSHEMLRLRNALREALGPLEAMLHNLPYVFQSGNVAALHAGADPSVSLAAQFAPAFCWGNPRFTKEPRQDGIWIVHGHHPVSEVRIKDRRIALDTGASQTGKLSAVRISEGQIAAL